MCDVAMTSGPANNTIGSVYMVAHGKINTSLCSRVISLSVRTADLLMKFKVNTT